ncbi:22291_t:CDS:2 [Rhizophagus irregularis]|nr:22291_t:CDS:2 [Rhizophagus irregularis]
MRKIYPPPFNKFVVFVFYSLLSIAAIVSSQVTLMDNGCKPSALNFTNRPVIGYVQPSIDPNSIQWDLYSHINFIGKGKKDASFRTKILLSIRNYDRLTWKEDKDFYDALDYISEFITKNNFDGVDIEYPGMRGFPCNQKPVNDADFGAFIRNMKTKLQNKIIIMLTVGSTPTPSEEIISLVDDKIVDLLNIETYHFSLYASPNQFNTVGNDVTTNPNSPYGRFKQAYDIWSLRISKENKEKIIMGIDFGNTFQVVTNKTIMDSQTVEYKYVPYDIPQEIRGQLIQIKNLCNIQANAALYSWPWKNLSAYALDYSQTNGSYGSCNTKNNWTRKFDQTNSVPWLYNNNPYNSNVDFSIFYVSYEDFSSLYAKLLAVGGVSISDISYDDDKNSLLNYIRGNQLPSSPVDLPPTKNNPGKGTSPLNPTDSTNADDKNPLDNHKANAGVIVGAVLGGLLLLVVSCFVWYRRKYILNSKDAGAISKSTMRSHTATKNAEMSCDSSPNRFAVPTTVIPVACGYVTAMFDFEGKEENDLSFRKGDKIEVLERGDGPNDWWVGRVNNTVGEFPGNYVKETGKTI